jgi:hypothetical protein
VFTPAPGGNTSTPLLWSAGCTMTEPSLRLPTEVTLFGAAWLMTIVCGNDCDGTICWRPGLLL